MKYHNQKEHPIIKYTVIQKIKLVSKIGKAKNKISECLKLAIAMSTYYYWVKKYKETGSIENKSRKPKHSPKQLRNRKIIKRIKELYLEGRGKYYIQALLKYEETSHIPLFIYDPRVKFSNTRRKSLVQTIDIPVTILDFFDIPKTEDMQGYSLKEVIKADTPVRKYALFGIHGGQIYITDGRYVFMKDYIDDNKPLYNYTQIATHMKSLFSIRELKTMQIYKGFSFTKGTPVMKTEARNGPDIWISVPEKFGDRLYDLYNDPKQENPIQNKEIEKEMIKNMIRLMIENDCPEEQSVRLGFKKEYLKMKKINL